MARLVLYFDYGPDARDSDRYEVFCNLRRHLDLKHNDALDAFIIPQIEDWQIEGELNKQRRLAQKMGNDVIKSIRFVETEEKPAQKSFFHKILSKGSFDF